MNKLLRSLLTLALLSSTTAAFAQRQGGTGASALGGGATQGGASFGNAASSALGSSALGGGGGGGGGFGAGGQTGTTGFAGPQFNDGAGSLGQTINNGFIGRSDNSGRLIGSQNAGQQAAGVQQNFGALGNRGGGNQNNGTTVERPIRPQYRVAFRYPSRPVAEAQTAVSQHLAQVQVVGFSNVELQLSDEGVATLRGVVVDADQRKLVEAFVRLEPSVRSIVNELAVAAPPAQYP